MNVESVKADGFIDLFRSEVSLQIKIHNLKIKPLDLGLFDIFLKHLILFASWRCDLIAPDT